MRIFFIIFFMFLGVVQSYSQNTKTTDSLLNILKKTRNDSVKIDLLGKLAYASFNQSPQQALAYAQNAQEIALNHPNKDILSNSYFDIAVFFHKTSEYDSAQYYYNKASHIAYSLEMQTKIFDNTGILFKDIGLYDSALVFHKKSLKLKETLGNRNAVAISYNNIGNVYFYMRKFSHALTHYYFSLEIRQRLDDKNAIAAILNNIGDAHRNLLEYDNAITAYTQALDIQKSIGNQQSIANTYHNIGNFYFHLKIYDKAQEYYSKALEIRMQLGNKNDIAASQFNIATVHRDLGNFKEGLKYYSIALELRKQTENKVAEALTLSAIAGLYKNQKLYSHAIDFYTQALTMQIEIGNKADVATLYERLGIVYKDTLLYEQAYEYYSKANAIYTDLLNKKAQARVYTYIGNLCREQLKFHEAYKQYIQAYTIQEQLLDTKGMAYTRSNMAEMFEKQNLEIDAIHYYETALDLAQTTHEKVLIESISYKLYQLYKSQGGFAKSLRFFELHNAIKDTLAHDKNIQRITELEFESNIKLLEKVNENQELKLREEQSKIAQQQLYLIIVIIVALLILGFSILLYRQFNQKKQAYNLLSQNRKELENTYLQLESTHILLQEKTQKLTDSINYATRIQQAILPTHKTIKETFNSHFIFYLPRDVVSGDFYWFAEQSNYTFIAAIDCTGHGIPGAFMSMIGNTLLNQIVNELHIYEPEAILNRLDYEIIQTLKQYDENNKQEDGMDISLLRYSKKDNEIIFAGAGQKLVVVENNIYTTYALSPFSIGGMHSIKKEQNLSFSQTAITVQAGMRVFLCSDGFIDQFGGENDERYTSGRLYNLLQQTSALPIAEQHTELSKVFDEWKGDRAQIDDVIIIGIEF